MPSNLSGSAFFQARGGVILPKTVFEITEWDYLELTPYLSRDPDGLMTGWASLLSEDKYGIEISRFFNDPKWNWSLEIQDAWLNWTPDQLGDRGIWILTIVYDPTVPQAEWDGEGIGKIVEYRNWIYYSNKSATSDGTMSQTRREEFYLTGLDPAHRLFLYVLGRQDSGRPVTCSGGQVNFRFTKYLKNG
jgi:hypothetical protein